MKRMLMLLALGGLLACNNPTPTNKNPVAAFTPAATTVKAGDALRFTSTSSDPDGDTLTQSWDFGDDTRGGGSSIAHVFVEAGAYKVDLTVSDGKGGSSTATQNITVTAGDPPGAPVQVKGEITDTAGLPLAGVTVKLGSSTLGTTDASGKVMLSIPTKVSQTLMLFKDGYTDQVAALEFPEGSNSGNAFFKQSMLTQAPAQTVSANTGGVLTAEDNAKLEIPANGLETESGTPVTGNVEVSITPLDVSDPSVMAAMPGRLEGTQTDGSSAGIVSLGMTDFSLSQNGQDLNLKPGSSAKVRIPLYADTDAQGKLLVLGDTIPLWSLNEKTGEWVQEGVGVVVDAGNGTKALEATVTHFSLWNADHIYDENKQNPPPSPPLPPLPEPKPKCKVPQEILDQSEFGPEFARILHCGLVAEAERVFDGFNLDGAPSLRPQNTTPRQPAWRQQGNLPIAGGVGSPVPPNLDIRFTACVVLVNQELCGSEVKKFQRGENPEFDILMRPTLKENVVIPLDITRGFSGARRQFVFDVPSLTELNFRVERTNGTTVNAQVEIFKGSANNTLGAKFLSGEINQAAMNIVRILPSGKYMLQVTPSSGSTGDLRIRIGNAPPNTNTDWKAFHVTGDKSVQNNALEKPCFASASNAPGNTLMAWTERKSTNPNAGHSLLVSRYNPIADSFEVATTLATNNVSGGKPYRCQIAISSNGDSMIVWWRREGIFTKELFWARRAANANAWSAPASLAVASAGYLLNRASELQLDANGNASMVWLEQHEQGTFSQFRTSRYNPSTDTWTTSVLVAPMAGIKLSIPSLASDVSGNQMVLYRNASQGAGSAYPSDGVYVQKYDLASSTWLAPTLVKATPAINEPQTIDDQITPMVLRIGTGGHAIAIWQEQIAGSNKHGSAKMNPSTGVWTTLPNFSANKNPALGISATGVATTVVYSNPSNSAGAGRYQARTVGAADAAWSTPVNLLQNDGGGDDIKLAMNPSGDAATVFQTFGNLAGFHFTTRSSSGNTWITASNIAAANAGATVSLDNNGQAVVVRVVKQVSPAVDTLEYQRVSVR